MTERKPKIVAPPILETLSDGEAMERWYEGDRNDPNLLSRWYPKIKDVTGLKVPKTTIIPVPLDVCAVFMDDQVDKGMDVIKGFVETEIIPRMDGQRWFMKNGCFSDKFYFHHAITHPQKVAGDFISIQYDSLCLETGGMSEIILREIIPWDERKTAEIYHGMPLRTEIRVFYDFDDMRVLYTANYWDYAYCRPHMFSRTDQIIFDATRDEIAAGYEKHKERAFDAVYTSMSRVDMSGKWSIDVLIDGNDDIWLIDMAQAHRSAYWRKCEDGKI